MAYPEDLVGNHEVWASLSDLSDGLANAESSARGEDIEVKAVRNIERLRDVVDHLEQVLNAADPSLVPSDSLDSINQHVTRAAVQVDKFTNSINVGNLQSANSHIDNALQAAAALWAPRSAADLEGLRQRLTRFRKSAGQLSANLKSDVQEARELAERVKEEAEQTQENLRSKVESKLNQLKETADETRNNIEDKYASQLEQLEERIAQHKEEVQAQKERLEKAISEHQSQFSEAQESRRKSFVEEQEGRKEEFQKLTVELEEDMTSTLERAKLRVDNIYDEVGEIEAEVRKSAEAIGAIGLTEAFKKTADRQRRAGRIWRLVAAGSLVILVGAAFWTFESTSGATDWFAFARKGLATASLLLLAGYSARQAGTHFRNAHKHRQMQVELTSLGPYIATLDEDKQAGIKDRLVDRWFGQQWNEDGTDREIEGASETALKQIRDIVREVGRGVLGDGS